jgi:histone deacetylase complex regulatory component SIN3
MEEFLNNFLYTKTNNDYWYLSEKESLPLILSIDDKYTLTFFISMHISSDENKQEIYNNILETAKPLLSNLQMYLAKDYNEFKQVLKCLVDNIYNELYNRYYNGLYGVSLAGNRRNINERKE